MKLLESTCWEVQLQDPSWRAKARARMEQLTMPHWALGRLMDLAEDLAGMTRSLKPRIRNRLITIMAGDHGVVAEGVSKFPQEVTPQMVHNFVHGGAGINALARSSGTNVVVVDMGVSAPLSDLADSCAIIDKRIADGTANMAAGPAMTREQAIASIEAGIEVARQFAPGIDVFGTGEMGIGNTTPSSAIVSTLAGVEVEDVTGRGTGIDDDMLQRKIKTIRKALEVNRPDPTDGLDVLAKVGGFEIGGLAGLILGAAALKKPVLVDGFIATAGALIAQSLCPACTGYMICAHCSVEPGHQAMMKKLGKRPLLNLNLRLGEGTGAAVAMHLLDAAVAILTEVATFEEAAVSEANA